MKILRFFLAMALVSMALTSHVQAWDINELPPGFTV
jgi:hypothetical protein